jgi:hemolysin activation/secretion protein
MNLNMLFYRQLLYTALLVLPLSIPIAYAQSTPDAGSLRQQIEQTREFQVPPAVRPPKVLPPPEIKARDGTSVKVRTIRFAGNNLLSEQDLAPAVADFLSRELDFAGLQRIADAVAAAYREAGWMVRAYLPEQDISEGVVTVQVIEARFAGVKFEGDPASLVKNSEIQAYVQANQIEGHALRADAMDRALLLVDDLPGVSVAGTLAPGQSDGETVLILQTTDEPRVYGDVGLDNTGSRATGSNRLMVNLNVNSPGGRGELLSLTGLHTQGSDYGRVGFTVPDRYNGMRLGVSLSSMNYKVTDGPGLAAEVRGSSSSMGADMNYPLVRSRMLNVYGSVGLENKRFFNQDTSAVRSDYESYSLRAGLSGNRFDDWFGGGANSASLQILWGRLSNVLQHPLLGTIDNVYRKVNYSFSRQQNLEDSHSLLISLQGQQATQVLDSSEKFYIGGSQSVRAFPVSELGGERGQLLSAEWRWRLEAAWTLTAFVDHGRVVALPATTSDQTTTLNLRGYGLSATWQAPMGVVTKLTWSRRDGSNPKANVNTGADGDGTLKLNRLWLTANVAF